MSLPAILKVTLKSGLSLMEIQDTFNEIACIHGVDGMEESSSLENVLYCGDTSSNDTVEDEIRKLPTVASVIYLPRP